MRICYLDEAGDTGMLPTATSSVQPIFVPAGLIIEQGRLADFTRRFLKIKSRFYPGLRPPGRHYLDWILPEVKGADVRREIRSTSRREYTHALGVLDRLLDLLEEFDVRIVGRVWIKGIGAPMHHRAVYTSSVQAICACFQHYLESVGDAGIIIADSRTKEQNAIVAHSVFTQKFSVGGDPHARILEMPVYGHSENHAGLQVADLVCSALITPMAAFAYCTGYVTSVHVHAAYSDLRTRYGSRLRARQYRFVKAGRWSGGLVVSDGLVGRHGGLLFAP